MHMIQAQVLHDIVEYIQDKCGKEPVIISFVEDADDELVIRLDIWIGRDYPGMKEEEAEKP